VRAHREIEEHNATESSFKLGHNDMSDWTEEEYLAILTHEPLGEEEHMSMFEYVPEIEGASSPIDWRSKNKV